MPKAKRITEDEIERQVQLQEAFLRGYTAACKDMRTFAEQLKDARFRLINERISIIRASRRSKGGRDAK